MAANDPWSRLDRLVQRRAWLAPLVLFVLGVIVYVWLGADRLGPIVGNDEYLYGNLAQSLADGDGFTWRGGGVGLRTVYPYVIAPAWLASDGVGAYELAKVINAVLLSATVWPIWLLGRELAGPRLAIVPAALFLVGMWMESSARMMTESLAVPAATLALAATVLYLRGQRGAWLIIAFAGAALAALARSQLAILVLVMALAVAVEVLRRPRDEWGGAIRAFRLGLMATWGATLLGVAAFAIASDDAFGDYASLGDARPNVGQALAWTVDYAADLTFMVGVVPWLVSLALLTSKGVWRDERVGPFLAVLMPALLVMLLFAGWFSAGVSLRPVERYVFYLAPLLLIGLVVGLPRIRWPGTLAATGISTLLVVLTHSPQRFGGETQALFGAAHKLGLIEGPGVDFTTKLAVVVLAVGLVIALLLWLRGRGPTVNIGSSKLAIGPATAIACSAVAALGMFLVSRDHWTVANGSARAVASAFGNKAPDAVEGSSSARKTLVASGVPAFYVMWVEFFNETIDRVTVQPAKGVSPETYGPSCPLEIGRDGNFATQDVCNAQNRAFVMATNPAATPTLVGGSEARGGLDPFGLMSAVAGRPQFVALRPELCPLPTHACQPATIRTWPTTASDLELRFMGGAQDFPVEVAGKVRTLPAQRVTVVRVPLLAGLRETLVRTGWPDDRSGTPVLERVTLRPTSGAPVRLN